LLPLDWSKDLVITEFDGFKDFIAIYGKRAGIPEVCIQDLETKEFHQVTVDGDVGEILPGLN
jgi:phosphohistidine swiveling domain-containing protein